MANGLLGEVKLFGAAILQTRKPEQRHAAIVFRDRGKTNLSLLHLAWHFDLICEPYKPSYRCVPSNYFDEEELQLFAEQASRIYEENPKGIPYGLGYTGASVFGGDLKFIDVPGAGLTCATFILGFFDSLGYDVLDLTTWQNRAEDVKWQTDIFGDLEAKLEKDAADHQKNVIGSAFRFRPEEVVGSFGIYEEDAIPYQDAVAVGAQLLAEIK
ncbi:hypothetical protein [Pseudomonas zeae]|uniref:hypothetical protein n=1 Tax=Pseudomonas zeae TaxID=2745510 RepID=UPI003D038042